MLKYLKKFTLDILPSVAATIIGAYIVNHYIVPASAPKPPAATAASVESSADSNSGGKEGFAKGVAEKAAIEKTAEKAAEKTGDTPQPDQRRRRTVTRGPAKAAAPDQTASLPEPSVDERRDANELARAAIERLRNTVEPPHTATIATATPARDTVPALPAATIVTPHTPDVFNAGTGAVLTPAKLPPAIEPVRSADASRPIPPAAIPAGPPLDLQGDNVVTGRTTVAEDVMSAAKSVIHAVLPR